MTATNVETIHGVRTTEAELEKAPQEIASDLRKAAAEKVAGLALDTPPDRPSLRGLAPETAIKALEQFYVLSLRFGATAFPASLDKAKEYAAESWCAALPDLVDRRSVIQFLACVASGAKLKIITGQEAKMYVFLAQTQLTVLKLMVEVEEATKRMEVPPPPPSPGLFAPMPQNSMEPEPAKKAGKR